MGCWTTFRCDETSSRRFSLRCIRFSLELHLTRHLLFNLNLRYSRGDVRLAGFAFCLVCLSYWKKERKFAVRFLLDGKDKMKMGKEAPKVIMSEGENRHRQRPVRFCGDSAISQSSYYLSFRFWASLLFIAILGGVQER